MKDPAEEALARTSEKSFRKFGVIGTAGALSFIVSHVYVIVTMDALYPPWFLNSQHAIVLTEMWMLFTSTICVAVSGSRTVISAIVFFGGVFVGIVGCLTVGSTPMSLDFTIPAHGMILLMPAIGFGALIGHGMKMLIKMNGKL